MTPVAGRRFTGTTVMRDAMFGLLVAIIVAIGTGLAAAVLVLIAVGLGVAE